MQIVSQLSVKVWSKSKKHIDQEAFCQTTIDILEFLKTNVSTIRNISEYLGNKDITELRRKLMNPLSELGYVTMTNPDKPKSSKQTYCLTETGLALFN